MTNGYIFLGVDDVGKTQNIKCAYALSISLKLADPDCETCVVVHKFDHVPRRYESGFDYIVELPYGRSDTSHHNMFIDFWQLYHCTPFDESMIINTYSLAIDNIKSLWDMRDIDDIVFATAHNYRGDNIRNDKKFIAQDKNNIKAFNSGVIYFRKEQKSSEFFKMADPMFRSWREIYDRYLSEVKADDFDFTLMTNIVADSLHEQYAIADKFKYTDLEIDFLFDADKDQPFNWSESQNIWITSDLNIKVNNYRLHGIFHYGDPEVITPNLIKQLDDDFSNTKNKTKA